MFRITLTLAFIAGLAANAVADDTSVPPSAPQVQSDSGSEALEIMRDHVRAQMDWRSYFSNRMDVRRRARSAAEQLRSQPSTASTVQTR